MTSPARPIVVLDFGSQFTQLIARRIREARVFSVVLPGTAPAEEIARWKPAGVILSGGPQSVYERDAPLPSASPDAGRNRCQRRPRAFLKQIAPLTDRAR